MKSFDQTYADSDFQEQMHRARSGWMSQVAKPAQPDLNVEGMRDSVFARVLAALFGRRGAK